MPRVNAEGGRGETAREGASKGGSRSLPSLSLSPSIVVVVGRRGSSTLRTSRRLLSTEKKNSPFFSLAPMPPSTNTNRRQADGRRRPGRRSGPGRRGRALPPRCLRRAALVRKVEIGRSSFNFRVFSLFSFFSPPALNVLLSKTKNNNDRNYSNVTRCSAMLATQLNGLVRGGSIDVGTMLRLDDYLVNTLNGRKCVFFFLFFSFLVLFFYSALVSSLARQRLPLLSLASPPFRTTTTRKTGSSSSLPSR